MPSDVALHLIPEDQWEEVTDRASHVREVLSGYKSGTQASPLPGEPRDKYDPRKSLMSRYEAKAAELHVSVPTVRNWVRRYQDDGVLGLADRRSQKPVDPLQGCSPEWIAIARTVIKERTYRSNISTKNLLLSIEERVNRTNKEKLARNEGASESIPIPMPTEWAASRAVNELNRNKSPKSARKRREAAEMPRDGFGRFEASRPGQLVLLDTNRLDVWALNEITLKWVQTELTVAMDVYSGCILGLRLSPISTRSIDVAPVLYEIVQPHEAPPSWPHGASWPYHGVPETVLILDEDDEVRFQGPGILPDAVTVDHGKVYVSAHIVNACAELGISIRPARKYTPTDKAPIERFFGTLRTGLLDLLPGYKGQNIEARGIGTEEEAFYTVKQLEEMIREWVGTVYHRHQVDSLSEHQMPGLRLSPMDRYALGVASAGAIVLPRDPHFALHFLPVTFHVMKRDGVYFTGLIFKGPILAKWRDRQNPYGGPKKNKWPFRYDPSDLRKIYFLDPEDRTWHILQSQLATSVGRPFGSDALEIAKRLAMEKKVPLKEALLQLLAKFGAGLELTPGERKAAIRENQKAVKLQEATKTIEEEASANDDALQYEEGLFAEDYDDEEPSQSGHQGPKSDEYYDDAAGSL
ncbi:Mu transposase C-terminal domain-containing protein [Arthrobacter sp. JZ12]|uniref:Mu transposase C-terminal domain-containing protein n=1 Tax=Arthrobacter sp. JZ12 TaxID=2654190 RepID=UPI002B472B64|nr:Mu transposase C-terminal domain-containing protein [Arthrobacter sp. JZ12]